MNEKVHTKDLNREHDESAHIVETRYAGRVTDEVVERIGDAGEKIFGEVIATFGTGADRNFSNPDELIDHYGTMCVVRYADKKIGVASRAHIGEEKTLHPGRIFNVDETIYFGRFGDTNNDEPLLINRAQVLGREALTGLSSAFEPTVSRIQGSLRLNYDGSLDISDGHEYADPETRIVIDKKSANGTRVHVSAEYAGVQPDIITPIREKEKQQARERRIKEVFGVPEQRPRDRFGNILQTDCL